MKTKVQTFLHLKDSKGWEKMIEWSEESLPPVNYFVKKRSSKILQEFPIGIFCCSDFEAVEFEWCSEKTLPINDKFFDLHVYYEENLLCHKK